MITSEHLMYSKMENLERLAKFLGVSIPTLRDEYAKRIVLVRNILEVINKL